LLTWTHCVRRTHAVDNYRASDAEKRIHVRFYRFAALAALLLTGLQACSTPGVGDPCLPEQIPSTGFSDSEAYIESSSVQCETRVCLVYHLKGDPRPGCVPSTAPPCAPSDPTCVEPPTCAPACPKGASGSENCVENRVYCSCRCDAGDTGFAACECPQGFECEEVLTQGGPGVRGHYCIRKGTGAK
jgi:hypothetical protein